MMVQEAMVYIQAYVIDVTVLCLYQLVKTEALTWVQPHVV